MAKLDQVIEQVLAKIKLRKQQSYEIDYQNQNLPPNEQVYIDNANVTINDVTIDLLVNLYRINTNDSWVQWILQGISFQVIFTFHISRYMINFIPKKMLLDWPVIFIVDKNHPVFSFYQNFVSRQNLAILPDESIIILKPNQFLTAEAEETLQLKRMTKKVRGDEDCIWQK